MRGALLLFLLLTSTAGAQSRSYRVRSGDTLGAIARRFHVSVSSIQSVNRLRGERVRVGQELVVPPRDRRDGVRSRRHLVRAGDTLARVARRYRLSVRDVQVANGMGERTSVRPGETLLLPMPGQSAAALRAALREGNPAIEPPPELAEDVAGEASERARALGLGPTPVAQRVLREPPRPEWVQGAGDAQGLEGTLRMPVDEGRYLRGWGSGAEGYHLAIDIGAAPGTAVHAAERGVVAYSGTGVRGYGNFVILVHPNGWVTAYAHHRRNLVVAGQLVERGEVIAEVGSTGFAQGPHLHFMLVSEGRHCDPMPLFRPALRREGVEHVEAVWDAELRPSVVQCLSREERPHPHYERGRRRR